LLDTSILLSIPENRARVFEGIREKLGRVDFFITSCVDRELEKVGKKAQIELVRKVLEANNVEMLYNSCNRADDCLAEKAGQGYLVATSDSELKKRIKGFGGRIIYLKKGKLVEIE